MKKSSHRTNSSDLKAGLRCVAEAKNGEGVITGAMTILGMASLCLGALLGTRQSVAADATANNDPMLTEIVVTANKRAENLQDVAASVSVANGEQLIQRGQTQLADYAAYMPGFNVGSNGSPGLTSVSLRGISSNTSTTAIGTYLDDTPIGSSSGWAGGANTLLDMLPYDLDRIEVLRGPQGTLYGAGAMGGLIKYVLKAPSTTEVEANVGADVSTIDGAGNAGYSVRARVNVPAISEVLGVSLSVFDKKTPGFMTNVYTDERHTNRVSQYGARLAALWTPLSSLSVKLTAVTQNIEANDLAVKEFANGTKVPNADGALILAPTAPLPTFTENYAFLQPYNQRINYFSATVDWMPGPFEVVSATSWSSQRSYYLIDTTPLYGPYLPLFGGGPGLTNYVSFFGLDKFTQEFRLVSPKGKTIEWMLGVFDTHENSTGSNSDEVFNLNYTPVSGALAYPPGLFYDNQPETFDERAVFGNLTWNLTDAFSITGGARYAKNDQDINFYVAPGPFVSETGLIHIGTHEGAFSWMGSAEYHLDKDSMVYARVATGYRPGGPNSPIPGIPTTYGVDSLINYELGLKSTFLDKKALVDFAVYYIDWKNIQLIAVNNVDLSYLANGGKAVTQGLELTSEYSPIRGLTLGLNAAYTDAHLTSVIPSASYLLTGYQLPNVPKESASLTADYDWSLNSRWTAEIGGAYRYVGKQWLSLVESASPASSPTVQAAGYSVFDLNASVRNEHVSYKLYVRNLANNLAITGPGGPAAQNLVLTNSATGIPQITTSFLQPRTIGLGVDYTF